MLTQAETRNVFTVDVEDYFMVSAFADVIKLSDWPSHESRIERNTLFALDLLSEYNVHGTFFVLGWIAERHPGLVREIHARGHEIACHGHNHQLIYRQTPKEFRQDVVKAKDTLEGIIGSRVLGYRAPSYSIVGDSLWALDVLIESGFRYDSSIVPVHHDRYGIAGAKRFLHCIDRASGRILEVPPSTVSICGQNIPVAGGGYLRLFPRAFTRAAIRRMNRNEGRAAIVYIHPWELDPAQPRLNGAAKSRFRHYVNLKTTVPKLHALLSEFRFTSMRSFIGRHAAEHNYEWSDASA